MIFRNYRIFIAIFLYLGAALLSTTYAKELYITDDYLQGLDDEISSPEYLDKAKQELKETERSEKSRTVNSAEIEKALISLYNFEDLLRTKYPSNYSVYSKLPTSSRIIIFDKFKTTKRLSDAKRLIIQQYEAQ